MTALFLAVLAPLLFVASMSLYLCVIFVDSGPRQSRRLLALAIALTLASHYCGHAASGA